MQSNKSSTLRSFDSCVTCNREVYGRAFCSQECRLSAIYRSHSASEPTSADSVSGELPFDVCKLRPLPPSVDFGRYVSTSNHESFASSEPLHGNRRTFEQSNEALPEQAYNDLKEYTSLFDQTRNWRRQIGALYSL
jgi:hypothetical protein